MQCWKGVGVSMSTIPMATNANVYRPSSLGSFFYLHFADEPGLAVAQAPDDVDLGNRLLEGGEVTDWRVLTFVLDEGVQVDYLANTFAFRLCSQKLREVIDGNCTRQDVVQWLPAVVTGLDRVGAPRCGLHFPA